MRIIPPSFWVALLWIPAISALYADDAGSLDFKIATTGHGVTRTVHAAGDLMLTSDASPETLVTSCYVSMRRIVDGDLLWRRNVCSVASEFQNHAIAMSVSHSEKAWFSIDHAGIVRAWTWDEGNLLWDSRLRPSAHGTVPRIWAISEEYVVAASNDELTVLKSTNGEVFDTIIAGTALGQKYKPKQTETLQWLAIAFQDATLQGVLAFVGDDGTTTGHRMVTVQMKLGDNVFDSVIPLDDLESPVIASSVDVQVVGDKWYGIARTAVGLAHFSMSDGKHTLETPSDRLHPAWKSLVRIQASANPSVISVQGVDETGAETMALYRFDDVTFNGWEQLYGSQESPETDFSGAAYCSTAELVVAMAKNGLKAYRHDAMAAAVDSEGTNAHDRLSPLSRIDVVGEIFIPDGDSIESLENVECSKDSVKVVLSTARGTTTLISFEIRSDAISSTVDWTSEEGLAQISSAVVLDGSHLGSDDLIEQEDGVSNKLAVASRISSQIDSLLKFVSAQEGAFARRDHIFGFVKIAALLSQANSRVWGIATSGADRGSIRWSLDLPKTAFWHTMVHGTTNTKKSAYGINGGSHSREILLLSTSSDSLAWKCIDGTNGAIHSEGEIPFISRILQIIPIHGSTGACRQAALLLHEDRTFSSVPLDDETDILVREVLKRTPNGLYSHLVDTTANRLESYQVALSQKNKFSALQVGRTSFQGERILKVSYPLRDEVVQTKSTILGDNSLLLKYLNPHMAVIVTLAEDTTPSTMPLVTSIERSQGIDGQKRKPAGAGETMTSDSKADANPNLFINLVDTVSGRVLHRASHPNADATRDVVVLVSENWVIYSFSNIKTRRTELGVLTLHEGMIDSRGIGPFTSPEQKGSFSSFDARESKPVVLAKTYTFPKLITALGVTATKGGISSRNILLASDDGKISLVSRKLLETRRPVGQVKDMEKKEGLFPYAELVPQVPSAVFTYNHTVEAVKSLIATPTALESQSLILAFGGPDVFVTRLSPSRGFDLLPDSFSRVLVSIVSVGLVVVLFVVRKMGSQKLIKNGWQ